MYCRKHQKKRQRKEDDEFDVDEKGLFSGSVSLNIVRGNYNLHPLEAEYSLY